MIENSDYRYVNGDYLKKNPDWGVGDSVWKANIISQIVKANNITAGKVIEVGCGAGAILEQMLNSDKDIRSLIGYDISPQAIAMAKSRESDRLLFKNIDFFKESRENCDLLLVIDVLEHVDNFYQFLRDLKIRSNYFVFHIPLDLSCRTILKPHVLLQHRESVGHIHYFSKEMVLWFLRDTGYQVIDWVYTKPVIDRHASATLKGNIKKTLRNCSFRISNNLSSKLWGGYSMMILAK